MLIGCRLLLSSIKLVAILWCDSVAKVNGTLLSLQLILARVREQRLERTECN